MVEGRADSEVLTFPFLGGSHCCAFSGKNYITKYRKIPVISPWLIIIYPKFFLGGLIIGGSFVLQKWLRLCLEGILGLKMRDLVYENPAPESMCGSRKYPYPTTKGIENFRGVGGEKPRKIQRGGG